MSPSSSELLEASVEAFEAARAAGAPVTLEEFAPDRNHPAYDATIVELIRVDMEYRWQDGRGPRLDDYVVRFADVLNQPECLAEVAFEEYRQRRLSGEAVARDAYARHFAIDIAAWPELPVGCSPPELPEHHVSGDDTLSLSDLESARRLEEASRELPLVGERFLHFDLVGELGRGAFGRVYLARQGDLANRFVALKITPLVGEEPRRLAQLQHTNIVPIYSLHQHGALRALCMPFLGPTTLADVVRTFQVGSSLPVSAKALLTTITARQSTTWTSAVVERVGLATEQGEAAAPEGPSQGPVAPHRLDNMSYLDAVTWIVTRVADGLAHAHERGILHRDLKPANILLTDDGEPLILDFNLAARESAPGTLIGGTLPYMAPEHLEAVQKGGAVDARADIYSLGVILFELLTGRTPYPLRRGAFEPVVGQMLEDRRSPAPRASSLNPQVTPGLDAILGRCLAIEPDARYATARQLREDLQRHLDHRPLRHAPDRSPSERLRKWIRRHPRLSSATTVGTLAALVLALVVGAAWARGRQFSRHLAQDRLVEFTHTVSHVRSALNSPFVDDQRLHEAVVQAEQALSGYDLLDAERASEARDFRLLDKKRQRGLAELAAELLYLLAAGEMQQALRADAADAVPQTLETALRYNERAGRLLGDPLPRALGMQRERLLESAGMPPSDGPRSAPASVETPRESEWSDHPFDRRLLASELVQRHKPGEAAELLESLVLQRPEDNGLWFSLGSCYLELHRYAEAEGCFSTAVALQPDAPLPCEYRGLARYQQQRFEAALADFDQAARLQARPTGTLVNRSLAHQALGHTEEAIADLDAAVRNGATQTRIYFLRARLHAQLGRTEAALADRDQGFSRTPTDADSWVARGVARLPDDSAGAQADFRAALQLDPRCREAWQNLAHVLAECDHQPRRAIEALDRLLDLDPRDRGVQVTRAVLLARCGEPQRAAATAELAAAASDDPFVWYQAGCVHALNALHGGDAEAEQARTWVIRALAARPALSAIAATDPDLGSLRQDLGLRNAVAAARQLTAAAGSP